VSNALEEQRIRRISEMTNRYISWSQYRLWRRCPHKHWLIYDQKEPRDPPSKWTDFGSAVHNTAEEWFKEIKEGRTPDFDPRKRFVEHFVALAKPNHREGVYNDFGSFKNGEILEWGEVGQECAEDLIEWIPQEFEGWDVWEAEHDLFVPLSDKLPGWNFKGFIDLVLRKGDKFCLLDYKTTSWGWDRKKKMDKYVMGQIQADKHFLMKQHPDLVDNSRNVKLGYVLVKRTGKPGKRMEMLPVSAGPKAMEDIQRGLEDMVGAVEDGRFPKLGKTNGECKSFGGCSFSGTKKCPWGK